MNFELSKGSMERKVAPFTFKVTTQGKVKMIRDAWKLRTVIDPQLIERLDICITYIGKRILWIIHDKKKFFSVLRKYIEKNLEQKLKEDSL